MSINPTNLSNNFAELRIIAKNIRVLYVEDDPLIRREYYNFLSRFFTDIACEENGKTGAARALEEDFDLVISDIQMPLMNGLEMIKLIKETKTDQATILISAHKDSDILQESLHLGVDGYIFKPLDRNQTIELLYKVVRSIHMMYENKQYKNTLEELVEQKTIELIESFTIDKITKLYTLARLQQDIGLHWAKSIAIIKIRSFKNLNDFYGYTIGNEILQQTAAFLQHFLDEKKIEAKYRLYRLSGAHYALLSADDSDTVSELIHKLVYSYEYTEITIDNEPSYLEMDAGVLDNSSELTLSNADKALRQSERLGNVILYKTSDEKLELITQRIRCKDSIKRAHIDGRFVPFYQPIIDNSTHKIIKYEALARMLLVDGTIVSPFHFLPIAKETKMYNKITTSMIEQVLKDFETSECCVSINLSIDDITNIPTRNYIFEKIQKFPQPRRIIFEILESEEVNSYSELQNFIREIKSYGCRVAIDDFGSGYSNFEYLAKLNADYIKLDGSLIQGIEHDFTSQTIIEMLSGFAKKMGIKTIAEFVSNDAISQKIRSIGIDESQGYHFGEPVPYAQHMQFIQSID